MQRNLHCKQQRALGYFFPTRALARSSSSCNPSLAYCWSSICVEKKGDMLERWKGFRHRKKKTKRGARGYGGRPSDLLSLLQQHLLNLLLRRDAEVGVGVFLGALWLVDVLDRGTRKVGDDARAQAGRWTCSLPHSLPPLSPNPTPAAHHALLALLFAQLRDKVEGALLLLVLLHRLSGGAGALLERSSSQLLFPDPGGALQRCGEAEAKQVRTRAQ